MVSGSLGCCSTTILGEAQSEETQSADHTVTTQTISITAKPTEIRISNETQRTGPTTTIEAREETPTTMN
ncbi:unnamed protein product, partial [Didymodactylos carnosus]